MSECKWIDGPPPDADGLYSVWTGKYGCIHCLYKNGAWHGNVPGCRCYEHEVEEIKKGIRHCRLPDIPKPMPPLRRFRARRQEQQVIGVYMPALTVKYPYLSTPGVGMYQDESRDCFSDFEWIDQEECAA